MNVLIFEREKILKAARLLNSLNVSGTSNFRSLAELADILDSGMTGECEIKKEGKEVKEDGVDNKEIRKD